MPLQPYDFILLSISQSVCQDCVLTTHAEIHNGMQLLRSKVHITKAKNVLSITISY